LESCCRRPIKRNTVLEELRVKKISIHPGIQLSVGENAEAE